MEKNRLMETKEWRELKILQKKIEKIQLRDMFRSDMDRAEKYSIHDDDIYFDYSKNLINDEVIELLINLADSRNLKFEIERMFNGEKINRTEDRAVLHVALRNMDRSPVYFEGNDVMPGIFSVLEKMRVVSDKIRNGGWKGFTGKRIRNVINIGIGGSDVGPRMVTAALKHYSKRDLKVLFVSNIDGVHLEETLEGLDPEETVFIIASKTFSTIETLTNAESAKKWVLSHLESEKSVSNHFLAVTLNNDAAHGFGIEKSNVFELFDWVGGRYSLTSAIGLSVMISVGYDNFIELLKGFHSMDNHFRTTPFGKNIPVIMGLLGIWYNNFFDLDTHAVIPYCQYLKRFPAFVQECDMESNGKNVNRKGEFVEYHTGPIVWGDLGTDGQHAFFQSLHQGTRIIPVDFIGFVEPLNDNERHHKILMANLFAQARALAFGKTLEEVKNEGVEEKLAPYRTFQGNRPSNTILIKKLTPFSLGKLISMYEHKVFTQGIIWNIFSFDQWGVELGKTISREILDQLENDRNQSLNHDSSTNYLIKFFKRHKGDKKK